MEFRNSTPLSKVYPDIVRKMVQAIEQSQEVRPDNVYQQANKTNRVHIDRMIADHLLPGSGFIGAENMLDLHRRATAGASCLILMEHYSNFDLPGFIYLLAQSGPAGAEAADAVVAMAGMKLNEESRLVLAFTEAYARIVIYPSRYLQQMDDPEQLGSERKRSNEINRAALHEMVRRKHMGHPILVFPSGTRYREGRPETKRALKEIDSYLKSFDFMVFVAIRGNILRVNPAGEMVEDLLTPDVLKFMCGPVLRCHEFREQAREDALAEEDSKQLVADRVTSELEKLHSALEAV